MHVYFGEKFGEVNDYVNLGYQVDRACPSNKLILGTSFSDALNDVEQYLDFTDVYCGIEITHNYNSESRKILGTIDITFDDIPENGEYSVMLVVVQDSILYKQYDYGMSTDFGIPYVSPSIGYLDTFYHNHVVRDGIINGADSLWGEVIATNPSKGENIQVAFDYTLPQRYEFSGPGAITIPSKYDPELVIEKQITLVAYVSVNKSEVLNVNKSHLIDDSIPIKKIIKSKKLSNEKIHIKNDILSIDFSAFAGLQVYRLDGKKVAEIKEKDRFDLNSLGLSQGQYLLRLLSVDNKIVEIKNWIKY